jgi:hypothetical protein
MTTQIRIIEGETVIDRDMNDDELAAYKAMQDSAQAQSQADADRQALKEATLAKLGLTADEVAALLS